MKESPRPRFWIGLGRAYGGAVIFSLPLLMTMEMWQLGFSMSRLRLGLFILLFIPVLVRLSYHAGIEETTGWREDLRDAFIAYMVGFTASAAVLALLAVIRAGMPLHEIVGKISLQAVPASIGALLARSQLGRHKPRQRRGGEGPRYGGELFLMLVGALFFAFNVAPTEEMVLIAYRMSGWRMMALVIVSILVMHAFVYVVEFRGHEAVPPGTPLWSVFLRFTLGGYAVALLASAYILWSFGRMDGTGNREVVGMVIVLGFPASIGAAAARLVL